MGIIIPIERIRKKMEEEHTCKTCFWGKWYTNGYDITMMDEECGGCSESNSKWQPKPEPPKEETDA